MASVKYSKAEGSAAALAESKVILIIEDNPEDACLITRVIGQCFGHAQDVINCSTLTNAEKYISANSDRIITVLLDLGLPDSTSPRETFSRMRKFSHDIPFIILTGLRDHDLALFLIEQGAEDFLCKDQLLRQPDILQNTIEFSLRRHEVVRERDKKSHDALTEKDQVISWMSGGYSVS